MVAGAPTTFTVTYASQAGSGDIAFGQVQIDACYLGWDSSGNITLYYNPNQAYVSGTLGQNATISAGSCSINLANSTLSPVAGNPYQLALSLAITFPEQNWQYTDFFGAHEVYAWGTNAEGLETAAVDLGAMVVSPGQDYTLTVSPSGTTTVPYMGTVTLTVTATGLNGFTGLVNLQIGLAPGWTNPCFSLWGSIPYLTANSQGSFVLQNTCQYGSWWTEFVITGNAPSIGVNRTGSSNPMLNATAGQDFTITPGMPTPSNLPAQGSIQYPVTVTSIGNQSGYVNLTLAPPAGSSMPAGVTYLFAPARVYLSGGGTAQSTLTLSSTASTPGGAYPLVITGTLQATGAQRTAAFSLGTQVTTFQVTSLTGSAIAYNSGQEVQVTQNVPAGNAPAYTTCDTADPDVTCRVISTSARAVTLGITARKSAARGMRIMSFDDAAATADLTIADGPVVGALSVSLYPWAIPAGLETDVVVNATDGTGYTCVQDNYCDAAVEVVDQSGQEVSWPVYFFQDSDDDGISVTLSPGLGDAGTYNLIVGWCFPNVYAEVEVETACEIGSAPLTVNAPAPTVTSVTLQPSSLNLSTGDTNKVVTATVTPSGAPYTPILTSFLPIMGNLNSSCPASLTFGSCNGCVGSQNIPVTAAPAGCSGAFGAYAVAGPATSNSITVVVPPQALVQQLHAEARDYSDQPSLDPQQVAQRSIGMTDVNRFGYAWNRYLFGGVSTFQALVAQVPQQVASDGTPNGPSPLIDNAAAVFALQIPDPTAGSTCYWSPLDTETIVVNNALYSMVPQTAFPSGLHDPRCFYDPNGGYYSHTQIVVKASMPLNTQQHKTNSPAFMFERYRTPDQPSVVGIP